VVRAISVQTQEAGLMQRHFRYGGLLFLSLALVLPTFSGAQDKKTDDAKKDYEPGKAKAKDKNLKVKPDWKFEDGGKIVALDEKDDAPLTFTVRIHITEPNPDGQKQLLQAQQSLSQHQVQLAQARKPQDLQNARNAIQQDQVNIVKAQANLTKIVDKDVKFKEGKGLRVRYYTMPPEIDSATGEAVEFTKEDKDKAKGTEGYPGYKADKKVLKADQVVYVFFLDKEKVEIAKNLKADDAASELKRQEDSPHMVVMIYVPDPNSLLARALGDKK
jgi:hypothetical protein